MPSMGRQARAWILGALVLLLIGLSLPPNSVVAAGSFELAKVRILGVPALTVASPW
jgi:hypothetical protein